MKTHTHAFLVAVVLTAAGSATMGGYQPTVDPYTEASAGRSPQDEAKCRELALTTSGEH